MEIQQARAVMPDRKTPPPIVDAVDYRLHLKPYTKYVLDNGTAVYAIAATKFCSSKQLPAK